MHGKWPADESAGSAGASVLKHAPTAPFSGLPPTETDASASGSLSVIQSSAKPTVDPLPHTCYDKCAVLKEAQAWKSTKLIFGTI
jgi:hypothetical protein